jgi:hypothetical protein
MFIRGILHMLHAVKLQHYIQLHSRIMSHFTSPMLIWRKLVSKNTKFPIFGAFSPHEQFSEETVQLTHCAMLPGKMANLISVSQNPIYLQTTIVQTNNGRVEICALPVYPRGYFHDKPCRRIWWRTVLWTDGKKAWCSL